MAASVHVFFRGLARKRCWGGGGTSVAFAAGVVLWRGGVVVKGGRIVTMEELLWKGRIVITKKLLLQRNVIAGEWSLSRRKSYYYRGENYYDRKNQITRFEIHESIFDRLKDKLWMEKWVKGVLWKANLPPFQLNSICHFIFQSDTMSRDGRTCARVCVPERRENAGLNFIAQLISFWCKPKKGASTIV